jgi:hypothetical protein
VMRISILSKMISWPIRRNASFVASIALMRSRRVFLCSLGRRCARGKERHGVTPASVQVLRNAGHVDV